jgi:hypothetical protein
MTVEFWFGLAAGVLLSAAAAYFIHIKGSEGDDLWDWSEEAYEPPKAEPRSEQPRAVTRITSNHIDWEIR